MEAKEICMELNIPDVNEHDMSEADIKRAVLDRQLVDVIVGQYRLKVSFWNVCIGKN